MFGKSQIRLIRGLLLVVYALATSTAVLFHDHSASCDHDHSIDVAIVPAATMIIWLPIISPRREVATKTRPLTAVPPCPAPRRTTIAAVCRFLGLCSLPVGPAPVLVSHDLLVAANPTEPIHEARPLDRTCHSRAPPRLG